MKIRVKELKQLIREAGKKKQPQLVGIDPNRVINPAENRDQDETHYGMMFAKFLSNLAKGMTGDQVFVYRGPAYSYVIDPKNFLDVRASDGSALRLEYLSDLGKYASEFSELMFMTEPENFSDYVQVREWLDQEARDRFFDGLISLRNALK